MNKQTKGSQLRKLREAAGLKAQDVAEECGMDRGRLSLLERGYEKITPEKFFAILTAIQKLRDEREKTFVRELASVPMPAAAQTEEVAA